MSRENLEVARAMYEKAGASGTLDAAFDVLAPDGRTPARTRGLRVSLAVAVIAHGAQALVVEATGRIVFGYARLAQTGAA